MSSVSEFLAENGAMLLGGVTALLLAGTLGAGLFRSPLHRQRVCELSVAATLAWVVLACVPLPRLTPTARKTGPFPMPSIETRADLTAADIPGELIAKPQPAAAPLSAPSSFKTALTAARESIDAPLWLVRAFLAGAAASCGWLVLGHVLLWRIMRRANAAPQRVNQMIDTRLRPGRRRPLVMISSRLSRPVTCGAWRPIILLPDALLRDDRKSQLRQVLLHELGHVEQGDGWGSLLFCLSLPLLYFHPLYWWLRRSSSLPRELVADDWAARADGKEAYVTELVALARTRLAGVAGPVGSIGILQNRSYFYRRMRMLLQRHQPLATRCSAPCRAALALFVLASVGGSALFVGVRPTNAQVPGKGEAPKKADSGAATRKDDIRKAINNMTENQIAMGDAVMRQYIMEKQALQSEIENLQASGLGPENVKLKELARRQDALQKAIDKYVSDWREYQSMLTTDPTLLNGSGVKLQPNPAAGAAPPRAGAPSQPIVGGVQLDLVNLANTLVDAAGAVRLAKVKYEHDALVTQTVRNKDLELELAKDTSMANLETAQKRFALLHSIADFALESAEGDLARTKNLVDKGLESSQSMAEASSKVKMLTLILKGVQ